jgi:hypothetical protein
MRNRREKTRKFWWFNLVLWSTSIGQEFEGYIFSFTFLDNTYVMKSIFVIGITRNKH